jgi:hypothetical protein
MPTTLLSLASRDTTRLLHDVFAERNAALAEVSPAAVKVLVDAGLVRIRQGQLEPVDPEQADRIIHAAIDAWLPGILDEAS